MGVIFKQLSIYHHTSMKFLILASFVLAFSDVSYQAFYSKAQQKPRPAPVVAEPVCRQVPKEVCNQVPKTTYDSVTKKQCKDVQGESCANTHERKCQITQKPVQEQVERRAMLQCPGTEVRQCAKNHPGNFP